MEIESKEKMELLVAKSLVVEALASGETSMDRGCWPELQGCVGAAAVPDF